MTLHKNRWLGCCLALVLATLVAPRIHAESNIGWPAYGGADGGGHYSTATELNPNNVTQLEQAWVHRSGDFRTGVIRGVEGFDGDAPMSSAFIGTPIVVKDTLYYCTPFNRVFALDPQTGAERWVFDPEVDMSHQSLTNCRAVSSWTDSEAPEAFCGHRIILGTLDARLIALDGKTGKRCPDFGKNGEVDITHGLSAHNPGDYNLTSPAAVLGDTLIIGSRIIDSLRKGIPSGVVRAYSARTGELRWAWNPVPPGATETTADGTFVDDTTNVWSIISVDPERNLVIVPTGNSSPDYYGGDRGGNLDYYSSSVVALNGDTGEIVWHYQTVHHDIWDFDVPAQPTLLDVTIDGRTRPAVVQVTKMGLTFVLDRETGKPLHPVEERPVPQTGAVPGEYLSPTQPFPLKPEPLHQLHISPDDAWGFTFWDKNQCRQQLEELTTGPIYTPISTKGLVMYPSNIGGNNWGAPAVDPNAQLMVTNTKHVGMVLQLIPQDQCAENSGFPQQGSPYCVSMRPFLSPWGAPCTKPPWSTLSAVNLSSGEIEWQVPLGTLKHQAPWPLSYMKGGVEMGGPTVTAGGLVFIAAAGDRHIRAFGLADGTELWADELPTTGNAVPMTYVSGGRQFVVIAAGGHFTSTSPAGDYLVAYALPD
ncbi:MAG: pyrroloquinoline quinone-dependent dehydrogenase [Pseudomonadales bacterium]